MLHSEPIRISFIYQPEDCALLVYLPSEPRRPGVKEKATNPKKGRSFWVWIILIFLFVLVGVIFNKDKPNAPEAPLVIYQIPAWVIWVLLILGISTILSGYFVYTMLRAQRVQQVKALDGTTQEVEISEEGIRWNTEKSLTYYKWNYFKTFSESANAFNLLGLEGNMLFILPKRVIVPDQLEYVRSIFKQKIGNDHSSTPGN